MQRLESAMSEESKKSAGDSPLAPRAKDKAAQTVSSPVEDDRTARVAAALKGATPAAVAPDEAASPRNAMLDALVYGDNDLIGLVAYAMHEVNRRDWCQANEAANGRPPSAAELAAYLVGERLERRLDTYRRLAEDALAKVATGEQTMRRLAEGVPDIGRAASLAPAAEPRSLTGAALAGATAADKAVVVPERKGQAGKLIGYLVFLLIVVVALALLLKYGVDITQPTR